MLILLWKKDLIEPGRDIFDRLVWVFFYFRLIFAEWEKEQKLSFNRVFDNLLDTLPPEIHLGQDVLENSMDHVS